MLWVLKKHLLNLTSKKIITILRSKIFVYIVDTQNNPLIVMILFSIQNKC